jgi:hypothetical protein
MRGRSGTKKKVKSMRGRFGRRRIFGGGRGAWLGIGVLAMLALITRRREKIANVIKVAYGRARERFGGREQPTRPDTEFASEQAGESLIQENVYEETEGSTAEGEEDPSEEIKDTAKESARPREQDDGWKEASQGGKSAAAVEASRSDARGLPIEEYDSLTVSQVTQRLTELSLEEVEQLRDYEAENRNRRSIMQRFETRIRAARKNLKKRDDAETEEKSSGE